MCWPRAGPSWGLPGDGQEPGYATWVCKRQEVTFSPQTPPPGSPHSHPGPGGRPELQGRDIVPQPGGECPVAICLALASCRSVGGHSRLGVCVRASVSCIVLVGHGHFCLSAGNTGRGVCLSAQLCAVRLGMEPLGLVGTWYSSSRAAACPLAPGFTVVRS